MDKTFTWINRSALYVSTYLANQFILSNGDKHFLGIKPAYRNAKEGINSLQMAIMQGSDGTNYGIGNTDAEDICFHLTNLSNFRLAVILEKDGFQVANIGLRPGEYYCMDNQNMTTKQYFGMQTMEATVGDARKSLPKFSGNVYTLVVLAEKQRRPSPLEVWSPIPDYEEYNPLAGATFAARDFITIDEVAQFDRTLNHQTMPRTLLQVSEEDECCDLLLEDRLECARSTDRRAVCGMLSRNADHTTVIPKADQRLIDSSTHTRQILGGVSAEKLDNVDIDLDYANTFKFSITMCINKEIKFTPFSSLSEEAQSKLVNEFLNERIASMIKKKFEPEADCVICLATTPDILLAPCGHLCICGECSAQVNRCPLCRMAISAQLKA